MPWSVREAQRGRPVTPRARWTPTQHAPGPRALRRVGARLEHGHGNGRHAHAPPPAGNWWHLGVRRPACTAAGPTAAGRCSPQEK